MFGNLESIADEDELRCDCVGREIHARRKIGIITEHERFGFAARNQRCRRFAFDDFSRDKFHRLVEAVGSGGFEAGFLELIDDISLGFAQTFATRLAAFEIVVGEKLDVAHQASPVKCFAAVCANVVAARSRSAAEIDGNAKRR